MSLLSRFKVGQVTQIDGKWVHVMFVIGSVYYNFRAKYINTPVHLSSVSFNHEFHRVEQSGERPAVPGGEDIGHGQNIFGAWRTGRR